MPIPMTNTSIKKQVYKVAGDHGCAVAANPSPTHRLYIAANCRVAETWDVNAVFHTNHLLTGTQDVNGGIYYLPYANDMVSSMRLPHNPPATCTKFLTANLSGCRFYVDTIVGSPDLVVYHANTTAHSLGAGAPSNSQAPAASAMLTNLHTAAQNQYGALLPAVYPMDDLVLIKYDYAMPGEAAAMRKANQGRLATTLQPHPITGAWTATPGAQPEFMGGTTVCGFYNNGWQFYYQTWGYVVYDRTDGQMNALLTLKWNKLHKLRTLGTDSSKEMKVLHSTQIV